MTQAAVPSCFSPTMAPYVVDTTPSAAAIPLMMKNTWTASLRLV